MDIVKRLMPNIKFLECNSFTSLKQCNIILSLYPYRTKTILTIREKDITELSLAKSSKDASHTLNHTTRPTPFLQTSPGGTPAWSFSIWLLPVESPQAGFLNHYKYDFLEFDRTSTTSL